MDPLLVAAIEFVKTDAAGRDASHDVAHSLRVMRLAVTLAREEGVERLLLVALAAVLHDVGDHKYAAAGSAEALIRAFLGQYDLPTADVELVLRIVRGVSFKGERAASATGQPVVFPELAVVQDADRCASFAGRALIRSSLDAIGAIGIARAFTYGGRFARPLHKADDSTVAHFHDKLLRLRDLMKTGAGRRLAEERHAFMLAFLARFEREWEGDA